jgi:hypothetical protein
VGKLQLRGKDIVNQKTRAQLASSPFERRVCCANATIQAAPPAQVRLIASLVSASESLFGQNARSREGDHADGPTARPGVIPKSRKPSDGLGICVAHP